MLLEARDLGFLGPGPVEAHLRHAAGFAAVVAAESEDGWHVGSAADLGSGAGLPGLPLALHLPGSHWVLIDSSVRRCAFLRRAVSELGLADRVEVREERAEVTGRVPSLRGSRDLVVARSFAPPAVVAECGAPLLRVGGRLVVSEPPGGGSRAGRWPDDGLAELGVQRGRSHPLVGATFQVLQQMTPCPDRFPRRVGVPGKRPVF